MGYQNNIEILYHGLTGIKYQIENTFFAKGGEGSLHNVLNNDKIVAKIFKEEKRGLEREKKLQYMVQKKLTDGQLEDVAWPQDVIYDQNGFTGYIMPRIEKAQSLTALYSDREYDLRYRLGAAINLCKAIETVHDIGQVCGDLNPQNICINLDKMDRNNAFRVTLVDTDSYHIVTEDRTFRCEVGLADYLAPEIQRKISNGLSLRNAPLPTYTRETDLFALAVHIFSLLMNGSHPFACAKAVNGMTINNMQQMKPNNIRNSVVAPQPIENIKDGYFPFYEERAGITIPLYAPKFSSLPPDVRQLFVRTFVIGDKESSKRVQADEWEAALKKNIGNIVGCDKGHYFFDHVPECPFCKIERQIIDIIGIDQNIPLIPQQVIQQNKISAGLSSPVLQQASYQQCTPSPLNAQKEWNNMEYIPAKKRNIPMFSLEGILIILGMLFFLGAAIVDVLISEYPEMYSDSEEYYETEESSEVEKTKLVTLKLVDANGEKLKLSEDYSWRLYYEKDNEVRENSKYAFFWKNPNVYVFLPGHYSARLVGIDYNYDEDEFEDFVAESHYTSFDVPSGSLDEVTVNVVIND